MNEWMNASLQLKNLRHHPSTVTWPEPRDKSSSTSWWSLECLLIFSVYIQPCLRFRSTRCLCRTCLLVTAGSIMKVLISKFCFFFVISLWPYWHPADLEGTTFFSGGWTGLCIDRMWADGLPHRGRNEPRAVDCQCSPLCIQAHRFGWHEASTFTQWHNINLLN